MAKNSNRTTLLNPDLVGAVVLALADGLRLAGSNGRSAGVRYVLAKTERWRSSSKGNFPFHSLPGKSGADVTKRTRSTSFFTPNFRMMLRR